MQESSCALKAKIMLDNVELQGLVKLGEVVLERDAIDVPSFQRINKVDTGVTHMPEVACTFETRRNTDTRTILQQWYNLHETHDVTVIYTDATGTELFRDVWQDVECRKRTRPEIDLGAVSYAKMDVTLLPYDIVAVEVS